MLSELAQTPSAPEMEQVGSALTVRIAAVEATVPHALPNWARYCLLLSLPLVATV